MLDMPEVFKTQVRAILRASTRRNVSILLPNDFRPERVFLRRRN